MRGLAFVLTVAFVFASTALFVGSSAADTPYEPPSPRPQDARIHGVVRDQSGALVAAATIYASNYGGCCYDAYYTNTSSGTATTVVDPAPSYGEAWTQTDAEGRYSLAVYSGDNNLQATKDGYGPAYGYVRVAAGQDVAQDLQMQKYPEKTARIEGRIVDSKTGVGLRYASLSLQSPEHGVYECSVESAYAGSPTESPKPSPSPTSWPGNASASDSASESQGDSSSDAPSTTVSSVAPAASIASPSPVPYSPGCSIVIHPDGRFEGMVTPGYAILTAYHDPYRSCRESHDADGSFTRTCGPEYNSWAATFDLPAGETTNIRVPLKAKAAPDASVSGYLVDVKTGKAIPHAQVSFSNEDRSGYGYATTDGDGSYSLRLRSGFHQVSAYADGYFAWQGVLDVKAGETPLDVKLTPGQPNYGGCCYGYPAGDGYAKPIAAYPDSASASPEPAVAAADSPDAAGSDDAMAEEQAVSEDYKDLGGGLGPYDADERARVLAAADDGQEPATDDGGPSELVDVPAGGLVAALAALGLVLAVAVRRRLR